MYRQKSEVGNFSQGFQKLRIAPAQAKQDPDLGKYYDLNLVANYFEIDLAKIENKVLFLYTIGVEPGEIRPRLRRRAIYCWLQAHRLGVNYATNYHNFLVTDKKIGDKEDVENFKFWDENDTEPRSEHAPWCRITIKFSKEVNIPMFLAQLRNTSRTEVPDNEVDVLNAMNMIFSQRMNEMSFRTPTQPLRIAASGPNKFFQLTQLHNHNRDLLGGGNNPARALLVAQRGFVRSASSSRSLFLNINNATGVFYRPGPLSALIDAFTGGATNWPRFDLSSFLKGLRVRTNHLRTSNGRPEKIYTISCVPRPMGPNQNRKPTPSRFLFNLNGSNISVGAHYAQNHHHTRIDNQSDCVVVQCGSDSHPIYLPATVFDVLAGQPFKRGLSIEQLGDFIRHSCRTPAQNRTEIQGSGLGLFGINPPANDGPATRLGVSLHPEMTPVSGRILSPPVVRYAGHHAINERVLASGGWNLSNQRFARPANSVPWSFLQLHFQNSHPFPNQTDFIIYTDLVWNAKKLEEEMGKYGPLGSRLTYSEQDHTLMLEADIGSSDSARDNRNEQTIRARLRDFREKKVKLVLITLPTRNTKLYGMVKRAADVYVGIHTICSVAGWQKAEGMTFWGLKSNPQFLGNILLKYNLKLGGVNHRLDLGNNGILGKRTMFVGMDVTHPSSASQIGAPSIAAVVATEDTANYVHWPVSLRLQTPPEDKKSREVIVDLQSMFSERLNHWKKNNNNKLPEQIIVYRDGVSDGFFELIERHEISKIKQAIAAAEEGYKPLMVYFIVLKRHSTRFFPSATPNITNTDLLDDSGNPRPGLLVPDILTRRADRTRRLEMAYYLQSHQSLKGTARPAHYLLKLNEPNHSPPALMRLTHDFCYLFSRATRSVHIHPAVYYADLACTRARYYLCRGYHPHQPDEVYDQHQWPSDRYTPHEELRNSMFYI